MDHDVNRALQIFLGSSDGNYQPTGSRSRLVHAYPVRHAEVAADIAKYLAEDRAPDWSRTNLADEAKLFAQTLRDKYPELEEATVLSLTYRWAHGWK